MLLWVTVFVLDCGLVGCLCRGLGFVGDCLWLLIVAGLWLLVDCAWFRWC